MNKNTKSEAKSVKRGRGRPKAILTNIPRGKFTIKQAHEANPHIEAYLTVTRCIKRLVRKGVLSKLRETVESDGPGRPSWLFIKKVAKKAPAKLNASTPPVDLTPAPAPETPAAEPVTA